MKPKDGTTYPEYLETTQPRTVKQNVSDFSLAKKTSTPVFSEESRHSKSKSTTEQPLSLPKEFGRYTVKKFLGAGTMGSVYLAEDSQLQRQVALKTPGFTGDDPELLERFYREARSAATLNNKNICTVFDVGKIHKTHYISMAYIEGKPLSDFIHPEKLQSPLQIAQLIHKLSLALQEAHEAGVVHRDLKPDNIMVDTKGEPVIMDFGLAYQTQMLHDRMTLHGDILGTPAYMAPEQVRGEQEKVGPLSDQYSLGVVLYEMLCGQRPFSGTMGVVMSQILTETPAKPTEIHAEVDLALQSICLKMIQKEQTNRYSSMKEVANVLAKYLIQPASTHHKSSTQKAEAPNKRVQEDVATFPVRQTTLSSQKKEVIANTNEEKRKKVIYRIAMALFGILLLTGIPLILQQKATIKPAQKQIEKKDLSIALPLFDPRLKSVAVSAPILFQGEPGEAAIFQYHSKLVMAVCFSSDGNFFAASSRDGIVSVWEFPSGKLLQSFWIENLSPCTVQFSKDAQKVLVGYRTGEIRIWDRKSEKVIRSFNKHRERLEQVIYSPHEELIASSSREGSFRLWVVDNESELTHYPGKQGETWGGRINFLSDNRVLVSTQEGRQVFDIYGVLKHRRFKTMTNTRHLSVSPDKKNILISQKSYLAEWNIESEKKIRVFPKKKEEKETSLFNNFQYFPDGQHIAAIANRRTCYIWNVKTGKEVARYEADDTTFNCLAIEPQGRFLLLGTQRKKKSLEKNPSMEMNHYDLRFIQMPSDIWTQEQEGNSLTVSSVQSH